MDNDSNEITSQRIGVRDLRASGWFDRASHRLAPDVFITPNMKVVDVGCGGGQYSKFCARNGADVTAIDVQEDKISELELSPEVFEVGSIRGITSDCSPVPLPDDYAEMIICTEVLEHVESPGDVLAELTRVAKPGCLFLISVPDGRSEKLIDEVAPPDYFQKPNHIRRFSKSEFTELIRESGLAVERQDGIGAFWSVYLLFRYATSQPGEELIDDSHPLTAAWLKTWTEVMKLPQSDKIMRAMNDALPRTQVIVARKLDAN
jgi:ubiquinone/menaquinone biosynthesis C-methylase UbiE